MNRIDEVHELADQLDDALQRGDMAEVSRLAGEQNKIIAELVRDVLAEAA